MPAEPKPKLKVQFLSVRFPALLPVDPPPPELAGYVDQRLKRKFLPPLLLLKFVNIQSSKMPALSKNLTSWLTDGVSGTAQLLS